MPDDTRPVLTLDNLEDHSGNRLADQFVEALIENEDFIQRHMDRHDGEWPEKPTEINIKISIIPKGQTMREVNWTVTAKQPQDKRTYGQYAKARNGVLTMDEPVRQKRISFEPVSPEALEDKA